MLICELRLLRHHFSCPAAIKKAVEEGNDVNEVEGAGNTPMHAAAYEGWVEGAELLLSLGAKIDASNNAGDRPWHTAAYVNNKEFMHFLEEVSFPADCVSGPSII